MGKQKETDYIRLLRERFDRHRPEIARSFFRGIDPAEITDVSETGDRHLHGEAVLRVETAAGVLYYKPRDCAGTELFGELNELLFGERMVPAQICGEDYAFQKEAVRRLPAGGAERAAFYEQLGRLTAVFYALGSTDMHRANVISADGRPCVIDTETLLCAGADGFGGAGDFSADYGEVFPALRMSVGECMVLPRFYAKLQNTPLLPGGDCTPVGYEEHFIAGFRDGYRALQENRKSIFSLLARYAHFAVRYILRSTRTYNAMIVRYSSAASDAERKHALDRLEKGLDDGQKRRWRPILDWEAACIREGDVPYFWFYAGERSLRGDRTGVCLINDFLLESPIDSAKNRIRRMDENDLSVQCAYIRASLKHIDGWTDPMVRFFRSEVYAPARLPAPLSKELAVSEAAETLHALWDERVPLSNGRCLWHTPMIDGKPGSLYGLAEGFAGVGVFCRAASRSPLLSEKDAALAEALADACMQDMQAFGGYLLHQYPDPPEERIIARRFEGGFGFKDGLAGFLWALERCRDPEDRGSRQMLEAFKGWHIGDYSDALLEKFFPTADQPWPDTDVLAGGLAGRAASLLLDYERGETAALEQAGSLLAWMAAQKRQNGCYQVFPKGRKQYFLPAFLRGSTGIASVMLRYAELGDGAPGQRHQAQIATMFMRFVQ